MRPLKMQSLNRGVGVLQSPLQVSSAMPILHMVQSIADAPVIQLANAVNRGLPGELPAIVAKPHVHYIA